MRSSSGRRGRGRRLGEGETPHVAREPLPRPPDECVRGFDHAANLRARHPRRPTPLVGLLRAASLRWRRRLSRPDVVSVDPCLPTHCHLPPGVRADRRKPLRTSDGADGDELGPLHAVRRVRARSVLRRQRVRAERLAAGHVARGPAPFGATPRLTRRPNTGLSLRVATGHLRLCANLSQQRSALGQPARAVAALHPARARRPRCRSVAAHSKGFMSRRCGGGGIGCTGCVMGATSGARPR